MIETTDIIIRERGGRFYAKFKYWNTVLARLAIQDASIWGDTKDEVKDRIHEFIKLQELDFVKGSNN